MGKIWKRDDWEGGGGQIQVPNVHSFTMSQAKSRFRRVFLLFEMFFLVEILKISFQVV